LGQIKAILELLGIHSKFILYTIITEDSKDRDRFFKSNGIKTDRKLRKDRFSRKFGKGIIFVFLPFYVNYDEMRKIYKENHKDEEVKVCCCCI